MIIDSCDINRFDIHCYGRDVYCRNTTFRDLYNQFSSFWGTLRFDNCNFINSVPVLFETSYSAYSFFKLEMNHCFIDVGADKLYLINAGNPAMLGDNSRPIFQNVSWPNIKICNTVIRLPEGENVWTLFNIRGGENKTIYGISDIKIKNIQFIGDNIGTGIIKLSNNKVHFDKKLKV